ncbi:MAG: Crp/Fnr family transcriptional regulator [Gammaproteobacteria bacterium]|nr:Crp/Fnr family transcriptional regulator [Gammaproteobacteria bacterium]
MAELGTDKSITNSKVAALIPGWQDADDVLLEKLLADAQIVSLDRNSFVFHAGDLCEAFLVLLNGSVRVQLVSSGGREITLYRLGPGGSCILTTSCLLSRENYPAEAIAESDTKALAIPVSAFQSALETSTWFRKFVFDGFSSRLTNVIQKIEEIAFTAIDVRLAALLLELDNNSARELTHHAIATELGTAREVVSRHLKRFEAEGWVALGRAQISVLDRASLEAIAEPVGD